MNVAVEPAATKLPISQQPMNVADQLATMNAIDQAATKATDQAATK
jgi:hypothetical protein